LEIVQERGRVACVAWYYFKLKLRSVTIATNLGSGQTTDVASIAAVFLWVRLIKEISISHKVHNWQGR